MEAFPIPAGSVLTFLTGGGFSIENNKDVMTMFESYRHEINIPITIDKLVVLLLYFILKSIEQEWSWGWKLEWSWNEIDPESETEIDHGTLDEAKNQTEVENKI